MQPDQTDYNPTENTPFEAGNGSAQIPVQPFAQSISPSPLPPPITNLATSTTSSSNDNPQKAEDSDLIEKEWVVKAKAIVDQTKNDPHNQNKEVMKIKADYMKKRYNIDIKISDQES